MTHLSPMPFKFENLKLLNIVFYQPISGTAPNKKAVLIAQNGFDVLTAAQRKKANSGRFMIGNQER